MIPVADEPQQQRTVRDPQQPLPRRGDQQGRGGEAEDASPAEGGGLLHEVSLCAAGQVPQRHPGSQQTAGKADHTTEDRTQKSDHFGCQDVQVQGPFVNRKSGGIDCLRYDLISVCSRKLQPRWGSENPSLSYDGLPLVSEVRCCDLVHEKRATR